MKELNHTKIRPGPGRSFDNNLGGRMLLWMHPNKAIRSLAAVAAMAVLTGCETSADSVPKQTIVVPATDPIVVVAQAEPAPTPTPAPAVTNATPVTAVTNATPVTAEKKEVAAPSAAAVNLAEPTPKPDIVTTNETPVIQEVVPPTLPENLKLTEATEKIIKLAQGGVDENVMLAFVAKSEGKFDLEADEIIYLSDLGVPSAVLTAMLKKDGVDPSKAEALTAANNTEDDQPVPQPQPNVPVQGQAAVEPPPAGLEITTNYIPNTTVAQEAPPQTVVVQQQPQTVVVTAQPETVSYFYDSLSPYGSWFVVPDYGWCWQPTVAVVDRGWRPYAHRGRWIYSTSGWYWHSDYSWGWAPFHYGRWHLAGHRGWIWVPDRVWGPAWVSWRTTDEYAGWAPLPPSAIYRPGFGFSYYGSSVGVSFGFGLGADAYCFAPTRFFHHRNVWHHSLHGSRAHHLYHRSYVHNRYEWDRDRRHVVNNGIPRRQIEKAINRELRPVPVREVPAQQASTRVGFRERIERNGNDAVIVRPSLPARSQIANGVRTATTTPAQPAATPNPGVGATTSRFNRNRGSGVNQAAVVPSPAPTAPAPSTASGRSSRAERVVTPAPAPVVNPSSIEQRIGSSRRDRVFGSTSPAPAPTTPAPSSTSVPTTPTPSVRTSPVQPTPASPNPSGREIIRREITRPTVVTPTTPNVTTPAPAQPSRRPDFGRPTTTTPRAQISTPAPQVATPAPAPRFTPQPVTPAPRIVSPTPRTITPAPRTVTPAPRIVSPAPQPAPSRTFTPPPQVRTPQYSPPPAQSIPRSAPPSASPPPSRAPSPPPSSSPSRGGREGMANDIRNRIGR